MEPSLHLSQSCLTFDKMHFAMGENKNGSALALIQRNLLPMGLALKPLISLLIEGIEDIVFCYACLISNFPLNRFKKDLNFCFADERNVAAASGTIFSLVCLAIGQ